jgi:hypothetical protein
VGQNLWSFQARQFLARRCRVGVEACPIAPARLANVGGGELRTDLLQTV